MCIHKTDKNVPGKAESKLSSQAKTSPDSLTLPY